MKQLTTALLLLLALGANVAHAGPAWHDREPITVAQTSGMSLDQAVAKVRRESGGRILSAETVTENGKRVHRIKVLTQDNKVRVITVPAN